MAGVILTSNLVCIVSYDMPENLVLFEKEITELWTGIKLYLALCVNTDSCCVRNSWATQHTIMCLATIIACDIQNTTAIMYVAWDGQVSFLKGSTINNAQFQKNNVALLCSWSSTFTFQPLKIWHLTVILEYMTALNYRHYNFKNVLLMKVML